MIGPNYWTTGIKMRRYDSSHNGEGWSAALEFLDDGFCSDQPRAGVISTEGTLHTRYFVHSEDMTATECAVAAAKALVADAERLGIEFKSRHVYLDRENWVTEDDEYGSPHDEEVLAAVAQAIDGEVR